MTSVPSDAHAPRFASLRDAPLTEAQQALAAQLLKASRGHFGGPVNILLRSPEMALKLRGLLSYLNLDNSLPKRITELAILVQAQIWSQEYEWWAHEQLALDAGLTPAILEALKAGNR